MKYYMMILLFFFFPTAGPLMSQSAVDYRIGVSSTVLVDVCKNSMLVSSLSIVNLEKDKPMLMLSLRNHGTKSFPLPRVDSSLSLSMDKVALDYRIINGSDKQKSLNLGDTIHYLIDISKVERDGQIELRLLKSKGVKNGNVPPLVNQGLQPQTELIFPVDFRFRPFSAKRFITTNKKRVSGTETETDTVKP